MRVARGDGVGIEVCDGFLRAVRLRHDAPGRVALATEIAFSPTDDGAALDCFILLRAELGEPGEPTRLATFPPNCTIQRLDVTGRSGPELNEIRATLDRRNDITSTLVIDDGPRRRLLLIRWDEVAMRRLEDLAERAGFVDVTIEPSPLALARAVPPTTTYVRRLVDRGDAHHAVVANGYPVAAGPTSAPGRSHPDTDASDVDVPLAWFDDLLSDAELAETLTRVSGSADARAVFVGQDLAATTVALQVAGDPYPTFPAHDLRAPQRQSVALGAALGAAGLAGAVRPVDMNLRTPTEVDAFDRPWAIERVSDLPEPASTAPGGPISRLSRRLRPRGRD